MCFFLGFFVGWQRVSGVENHVWRPGGWKSHKAWTHGITWPNNWISGLLRFSTPRTPTSFQMPVAEGEPISKILVKPVTSKQSWCLMTLRLCLVAGSKLSWPSPHSGAVSEKNDFQVGPGRPLPHCASLVEAGSFGQKLPRVSRICRFQGTSPRW